MRVELQNEEHCRYLRVYHYYRNLILSGQMKSETKLPSIRKGANELQMSRTTMENAYMLLAAEGYIVSRPQSGYYVTDIAEKQEEGRKIDLMDYVNPDTEEYAEMVRRIGKQLNFTSLRFHRLDDMMDSVGIDRDKLCTYCWDGREHVPE